MKPILALIAISCGLLFGNGAASAAIVINEIHYNPDLKTEPAEFVELINTGTNPVNLAGWALSSGFNYVFPATNVAPGRFVVVAQNPAFLQTKFAISGVLGPFNTNGSSGLSKYADKVTLRNAAGQVEDEVSYQIGFPWPTVGDAPGYSIELINPDLDNSLAGHWRASTTPAPGARPTPGRTNLVFALNAPPAIRQVEHQPKQPSSTQPVTITAKVTDPDGVAAVVLQYQIIDPGAYIELTDAAYTNATNGISVAMTDAGSDGDLLAGDAVFTCVLPGALQVHRRLLRYRITVTDAGGRSVRVPYADDPQPNFAYFCYNGVPAWTGAVQPGNAGTNGVAFTVPTEEMNRLPVYQLITKSNEFAEAIGWAPGLPNNKYTGDNYLWTGTLVVDGEVYDHITFRCRGGVWRYSMGKNAMKFSLNRGHDLEVKDNWGRKLNAKWRRLSFRANIQQGDYLHRGEQGLFESVGYKLYDLAGANGLKNVQLQFRVIDDAREGVPGTHYQGDFYGLWLAVEEEDGRFLEERGLPDGNVYDMEGGTGTLNHNGAGAPVDKSDLNHLLTYGGASPTEAWWRTNLDLRPYYSYQAISQGIHQYDIADGKNYFYYKNPVTRLWQVWPWDLDLTWADNMYRAGQQGGDEPFKSRVLSNFASPGTFPAISTEFRNRVREIRDLLFNTDEGFKVIDEFWWMTRGTNVFSIVDADRAFWDYNPVMTDANIVNLS
ncbi:MAG TPA: lamin tail domain-containing protein, partial [Vicinamibacterales bacterium]|nr:lamin tail domain-containing protein [Vicinamibacterales bacterium]